MKRLSIIRYISILFAYIITAPFPIKCKKYLFISMSGNSYGGSPKAFSDYIKEKEFERVWAFSSHYSDYPRNVRACKLYSIKYYIHLFTCKAIISDQRLYKPMLPFKRKGQLYIQTWHGTPLKKIEADMPSLSSKYEKSAIRDSKLTDVTISGSNYMTKIFKNSFWYNCPIIEIGTPKNDVFFREENRAVKEKVHKCLGIPSKHKIVLYAPTFRGQDSLDVYTISPTATLRALGSDEEWDFVLRLHPNLMSDTNKKCIKEKFPGTIDATTYPDMQELLLSADIFITDYSSAMFDFMYLYRPCFIYATDIQSYDRGFYFSMNNLPFPIASSMDELEKVIKNFSIITYKNNLETFIHSLGSFEKGTSCNSLYNYIQKL